MSHGKLIATHRGSNPVRQHVYTPSARTDPRVTMAKLRRLIKRSQIKRALENL